MESSKLLSKEDLISFETKFFNLFETIDDMFIISSLDGNIIYCNMSLLNKMEYSFQELKNMNILDLHPKEKIEEASIVLREILDGTRDKCLLEAISKSGVKYEVETRIWFGKWNEEDCIYSISRDFTKENENLRLISKIFQNNPMPMIITDIEERKFIKVNPVFLEKTGYLEEELVGMRVDKLNIVVDMKRYEDMRNRLLSGEEIKDEELVIKCKDDSFLTGLFSIEEINNNGKRAFLIVMVDITEKVALTNRLRNKLQKLTNIIEGTNLGTWEWNIITGEVEFNEQWGKLIGYSLEELKPISIKTWRRFSHPDDLKLSDEMVKRHLKNEIDSYDCEIRMKHRDGRWIWVRDRGKVTERDKSGRPIKMFGTHSDITLAKEQSIELERFFSVNIDLLCILDMKGRFLKANKAWEDILGYPVDTLIGRRAMELVHKNDHHNTLESIKKLKKDGKLTNFINRYRTIDGEYLYFEWRTNLYNDVIYAASRDITERMKYEEKILDASNKDCLTGIYNRRYVYNRAEEIIERYKKREDDFSVCIIDIDYFKGVNDKYGHRIGDLVLKEFTSVIKENLRPYDILGRYGGEEFIVILNDIDEKESVLILERILNVIRNKTFNCNGNDINFTFSAGVANCKEIKKEEIVIDRLIGLADKRMYRAKNAGRNRIASRIK
ncbi:GGDEF domain-containing protein [Tissierella creatinophila]|uniref:Putative diguanylate cyclase YdaM n=1 Tax=Tissierella creatinophila DSM 6911 TaxID=1123403 RepID=A0A1U7M781_TISCR|nr:GGDEF domain-containing protein [Tissierella creatinophila]OLS03194.1 putative diguanylate cyclase YdaM [Tissierella creatinophila DSM 6911]